MTKTDLVLRPSEVIDAEVVSETIRAVIVYSPFDNSDRDIVDLDWSEEKTLPQYLDGLQDAQFSVAVNGQIIEAETFDKIPAIKLSRTTMLVIKLIPNKQIVPIIAMVAMVALTVFSGGIAGALALPALLGVSAATAGAIVVAVGGILISGAMMAANALLGPKQKKAITGASYGLDGPQATAQQGLPVPHLYGKFRVSGNKIGVRVENGYTYTVDGKNVFGQMFYGLYAVSEGPISGFSGLMINGTDATNYRNVEVIQRLGDLSKDGAPISWFAEASNIVTYNRALAKAGTQDASDGWIYGASKGEVTRLRFDLELPNGLYYTSKKGNVYNATIEYVIQYRSMQPNQADSDNTNPWITVGTNPGWVDLDGTGGDVNQNITGIRVTSAVVGDVGADGQQPSSDFDFLVQIDHVGDYQQNTGSLVITPDYSAGWATIGHATGTVMNVPIYDAAGNITGYSPGSRTFVYEAPSIRSGKYQWKIVNNTGSASMTRLEGVVSQVTRIKAIIKTTMRWSITSPELDLGYYEYRICRTDDPDLSGAHVTTCTLTNVAEMTSVQTLYKKTALYAFKTPIDAQMNSEPTPSYLVTGKLVNIYDSTGTVVANQWSDNPADVLLDILLNTGNRFFFDKSRIDFPMFAEWRQFCSDNSLNFNGIFDGKSNVWDVVNTVARVGRASVILRGLKWSLTIERPDIAVMAFTQDNIVKGSFKMTWLGRKDRANLIEVQYADADDFYKQHSVFITDPDYTKFGDAQVKSTINLTGVTSAQQAIKEGRLQLALNKYVTQSCEFDVFIQALAVDVGDVIYVQHDMPMWGFSGRVLEATQNSDGSWNVTSDTPIPADVDKSGSWQVMLLQSAAQIADATVTAIGGNGNTQIQIENYRAPTLPDAWMQGTDPAGTSDFQTNVKAGVHRVIVDGHDYEVLETTIVSATVALLTLSESFHSGTGSTANLFRVDQLVTGNISLGDVDEFNRTQKLTLSGWNNFAPSFFHVNDRIMLGPVKKTGKPFRVTAIDYSDEHVRHVSASEYNDTVYTDNPTYTSNVSSLPTDPMQVTNLVGTVNTTTLQGGALAYTAAFTWNPPLDPPQPFSGASVYQSINGSAFTLVGQITAPNNSYEVSCNVNDNVRLKVVGYGMSLTASYLTAPICSVVVSALGQTPDEPNYFTATGGVLQIALNWQFASDDYIAHYELLASDDNNQANGNTIYIGKTNTFTETGLTPKKTRYYWVRAVAISGAIGVWTGPTSAVTSPVLVTDLEEAIQNTAKYANDLLTSSTQPTLIDGIPASGANLGTSIVFNTKDKRLYQQQADGSWEPMIQAIAVDGKLTADQISDVAAAQVQQSLTSDQIALLQQASQDSSLTTDQKAQINAAATAGIATQDVMNLVAQIMGKQTNATQDQLENLNLANIAGTLSSTAVAAIDIASTSGQVTADKIASVTSTQITGKLTADQIADINAAQVQGQLSSDQIASLDAAKLAGTITADKLSRAPSNNLIWDGCGQDLSNWVIPQDDLKVESVMIGSLPAMKITALKDTNASIVWQSWGSVFSMALGVPYEYQLKSATTSSTASLFVVPAFFGSDGAFVGEGWANTSTMTAITAVNTLADFTTTWGHGFNFASGRLRLQVNAKSGDVMYITQVLWGASLANVTEPMQWVNGSRPLVNASAVQGQLTDSQLSSIAAAKIAGQLSDGQLNGLSTGKLIGVITSDQIAALAAAKIAGQLSSDQIAALDANKLTGKVVSGQIESLDADLVQGQLALDNIPNIDASKITSVSASTISGQITSDQVQSLAAAKVAGQLTSDQIAGLDSAKLTGKIVSDQITSLDADLVKGQLTLDNIPTIDASKISSVTSTVIQGQITSDQIAALQAAKIAGQLTSDQIISIDSSKLTGQIVSSQIESLNSDRINGQITSTQLSKASSNNILPNDCFSPATTGWRLDANQMNDFQNVVFKSDDTVPGLGNGMFQATASSTSGQFMEVISENFAVAGGSSVEYRIAVGVPTTTAIIVWLAYQTSDGTWTRVAQSSPAAADYTPNDLSTYQTVSQLNIKLPADAVAAQLVLRLYNFADQNATKQIIRFTQALVGYSTGTSTEMMTWVAGPKPSVTFDGVAGLLSSDQVASLDAAKLTGKVVSDQIASLDADLVKGQLTLDNIPTIDSSKITSVNAGSIQGQITSDQIASLTAAKVAGQLTSDQIAALDAGKLTGLIISEQIESLDADLITGTVSADKIAPISADGILSVNAAAVKGQISSDQIASLQASKVAGQLSSDQIAALDSSKLTGKIVSDQLTSVNADLVQGQLATANIPVIGSDKISSVNSSALQGQLTSDQIAGLDAAKLTSQITSTQISDGSISTPKIAAGAVQAANIAAGAITAEKLSVGSASNTIANSCCDLTASGWGWAGGNGIAIDSAANAPTDFPTIGFPAGTFRYSSGGNNDYRRFQYYEPRMSVVPGQTVQAQICLSSITGLLTGVFLLIQFSDISGNDIDYTVVGNIDYSQTTQKWDTTTASPIKDNFSRFWGNAVVPDKAVSCRLIINVNASGAGDNMGFFTRAVLTVVPVNCSTPVDWTPGGVTTINGGQIVTASIAAAQIAANAITSDKISANAITAGKIAAGAITADAISANAITGDKIVGQTISADKLAANSITSDQIAANSIRGDRLVANTITADQIAANAITASAISAGAITAQAIATSAVTTDKLAVVNTNNMLSNACFYNGTDGWTVTSQKISVTRQWGSNQPGDSAYVAGMPGARFYGDKETTDTTDAWVEFAASDMIPISSGDYIVASAMLCNEWAVSSAVIVNFYDASGKFISQAWGNRVSGSAPSSGNGVQNYTQSWVNAASPDGSRYAQFVIHADWGSMTITLWGAVSITKTLMGYGHANVTEAPTWTAGGTTVVSGGMITAETITAVQIAANAITSDKITANAITADKISSSAITADKIAANAVTVDKLAANSVNADKIISQSIGADKLVANSITAAQIAANSITGDRLVANTITATQIAAEAITASAISAGAITTQSIAAGAITAEKMSIANPSNLISNSDFSQTTDGWGWNGGSANNLVIAPTSSNPAGAPSVQIPAMYVSYDSSGYNNWFRFSCDQKLAVIPGKRAQFNFRWANVQNLSVQFSFISFYDVNGNYISQDVGGSLFQQATSASYDASAQSLDANFGVWLHTTMIPDNAAYAQVIVNINTETSGAAQGLMARAVFTSVEANVMTPVDWTPGGVTSITGAQIKTNSITANQIAANAITADKIAANVITSDKIAANTITSGQIAANSITGDRILANTIGVREIVAHALTSDQIAANSITGDRLVANTITASQIAANAITSNAINAGAITTVKIAAGAITADTIAANAITTAKIAASSITGDKIAVNTITAANISGGTITGDKIAGNTIGANAIVANSLTSAQIAAGGINADRLAANSITAAQIAANAITTSAISAGAVTTQTIAAGAVTSEKLTIASSTNIVGNSTFTLNSAGWTSAALNINNKVVSTAVEHGENVPFGTGALYLAGDSNGNSGIVDCYNSDTLPVQAGQRVCGQVRAMSFAATGTTPGASLYIGFYDQTGKSIGTVTSGSPAIISGDSSSNLNGYGLVYAFATAPANATACRINLRMTVAANSTGCRTFFTNVALGVVNASTTEVPAWTPGGVTTINGAQIVTGTITAAQIAAGTITGDRIAGNTISANALQANSITSLQIAANTITGDRLVANTIGAREIVAGSITATAIASGAITSDKIAANAVTASQIAANAITTQAISAGAVTAQQIATSAITADKLAVANASNVIWNGTGLMTFDGWNAPGSSSGGFDAYGNGASISTGNILVSGATTADNGWANISWSEMLQVISGSAIQAQARIANDAGIPCQVEIHWFDSNKAGVGITRGNTIAVHSGIMVMDNYQLSSVVAIPPANAAYAQFFVGGSVAKAGHFSFRFTNAGMGYCSVNATQVSDWTPGGATRVSGGQIITASITASQIAANAITTTQLAAGAVTANNIAANTITSSQIAANTITGDRMLANTIGVREIVAHSLTSDQIAASSISGDRLIANTITASQIAANAITTAAISAGAVTAQSIAAGAITAEKLAIASTANLVGNSTLEQTTAGWNVGSNWGCSNISLSSASFSSGMNGGRVFAQWNSTSVTADSRGGVEIYWKNMPVVAGSYYECQMVGYGISSGTGNVFIRFFDKSGNALGDLWSNAVPHFGAFPTSLSQMTLAWSHGQAPSGAVTAQIIVRLNQDPNSNEANGNLYFTNLLFAQSTANVTSPMAWSAGGVTSIDGGQIVAASITANQIAANAITAGKLAAGSVVAGTIAGSAVTADTIAANAITTPKISAGAITGDKIAANTITGNNITGGTITGNNIAGGTITGSNITGNTITGSNLVAGTVGAREIVAGSISTTQLAAGSITAEKLAIGSSSNLIVNSCFDPSGPNMTEWAWATTGGSTLDAIYPEKNNGFTDCWIHLTTANSGAGMFMDYSPVPVVGGVRYCGAGRFHSFSGMVSQINLIWRDASGAVISISASGAVSGGGYGFPSDFKQNWVFAYAPANAATVSFRVIVWNNTSAAITDTGVHATMMQLGPVPANCQTVPDWTAGGVTTLNGAMIKTGSLTATKIAANTITAAQIAGKTITANQIQSGSLTADVIAANAIGATQIAAGAVYSDAIQANAITASKLSAGSVTAQAIAAGSVTSDKLTVANTSNILSNACCYNSIDGWTISGNQKVVTTRFWGQNQSTESSFVYGMPGAKFFGDKDATGTTDAWIEIASSDRIAISSGQYIIASAMLCNQWGVNAAVIINFYDANGTFIAQSWGNRVSGSTPSAGNGIQNYTQSWVNVASPNGSRYAQFLIHADWGNRTDTVLGAISFTQAMFGYGRAGVTEAPTWTAGGTTTVTGGMITAQTITGVQIAANAITADKIMGGTITGDKIAGNTISAMSIAANTITTLQIAAGGITGDRLAANTITANQIGAGAITTENLAVGSTANLIWNSCLDDRGAGTNGWASNQTTISVGVNGWTGNDNYRLKGYGTGGIYTSGTVNSGDVVFADWYGTLDGNTYGVATKAGARFFGSAQVIPGSEFDAYAELEWLDLNGNSVGQSAGPVPSSYSTKVDQWGDLDGYYTRISTVGTAPAGTCWVRLRIVFRSNKSVSNVNNFFTKALLTQVADNVNDVPLWTPGGTTVIDGSTVRTGTLNASKIVAGSITGDKIAAGAITSEVIRAGSIWGGSLMANTITADQIAANTITAGQIQAGAIGADQIGANAIRARNLAVDDVLIANSAQIGNLVVGTSNISDSSVTSYASGSWVLGDGGAGGTVTFNTNYGAGAIISASILADLSTSVDGSVVTSSTITISWNGNTIRARSNGPSSSLAIPAFLGPGGTDIQVIGNYTSSKGGRGVGTVQFVVLGRMK